ncbi:MAG: lysophospholipid acyltransferase family protein [Thermonemataceae bacterium]
MPFFIGFHRKDTWPKGIYYLNKIWARVYFFCCFIPVEIERRFVPTDDRPYIYCANHSSYIDIITMGLVVHHQHAFVGKASLGKVPVFGYMYRRLHIAVEREKPSEAYKALLRMKQIVEHGKSIIMFPEGGIKTKNPPRLAHLKDGAFRVAIETQTPIIPVTIPYNWFLLKDDEKFLPIRHKTKAIVHTPIETKGLTLADIPTLKEKYTEIIHRELDNYLPTFEHTTKYRKHLPQYSTS